MDRPELIEDPRYATNAVRMEHNDELQVIVTAWVAERPRDEILKQLDSFEVVCSQVNDASDIVKDEHYLERTLVELTGVDALGKVLMPGSVVHDVRLAWAVVRRGAGRSASTPTRSSPSCSASATTTWQATPPRGSLHAADTGAGASPTRSSPGAVHHHKRVVMNDSCSKIWHSKLFIGGRSVEPSSDARIDIVPPSTGDRSAASQSPAGRVDAAVAAARRAFDEGPWPRLSASKRAEEAI